MIMRVTKEERGEIGTSPRRAHEIIADKNLALSQVGAKAAQVAEATAQVEENRIGEQEKILGPKNLKRLTHGNDAETSKA